MVQVSSRTITYRIAGSAHRVPRILAAAARLWHALAKDMFGTYRPERHYMRGPGPKWHERHFHA